MGNTAKNDDDRYCSECGEEHSHHDPDCPKFEAPDRSMRDYDEMIEREDGGGFQ